MLTANTSTPHKRITILGSTGSIGTTTLKLLNNTKEAYQIEALTAHNNVEKLAKQAIDTQAKIAVIANPKKYNDLKHALANTPIEAAAGPKAITEAANRPVDITMAAIVGAAGLKPTITAIKQGNTIALANKECLVCAGPLIMEIAKHYGTTIIPVDSEHSAIFQALDPTQTKHIKHITLTASGGPFRNHTKEALEYVTVEQALNHPNWKMGSKITIDSATMMNKGLEIIEAYHLFPVEKDQIKILIHPESIIHSMVTYTDGATLAQLGTTDMSTPIAVALNHPHRTTTHHPNLNLEQIGKLTFSQPDEKKFPTLTLAKQALAEQGTAPVTLNAANEVAVNAFLSKHIKFTDIPHSIEQTLNQIPTTKADSLEDIQAADQHARQITQTLINKYTHTAAA